MEGNNRKENDTKSNNRKEDLFLLGGKEFRSRFILGSGKYNVELIRAAVEHAGAEMITLAVRRANSSGEGNIVDFIPEGVTLLPNTSGARNAEEAVRIARLSRELGCGNFVKVAAARQPGDGKGDGTAGEGRVYRAALYVPGLEYRKGSRRCRGGGSDAAGGADWLQ